MRKMSTKQRRGGRQANEILTSQSGCFMQLRKLATLILGYILLDVALLGARNKRLPRRETEQESQENRTRTQGNTWHLGSGPGDFSSSSLSRKSLFYSGN